VLTRGSKTMQLKQLLNDDDAVSPVIGVILMVAITVILAAVIGTFVLGLGDQVQSTAPQASFSFDYTGSAAADVTITHDGGDAIPQGQLDVSESNSDDFSDNPFSDSDSDGDVEAGDSASKTGAGQSGETIRVVWTSDTGDSSATLGKSTAPN
jgi:flagellin-like protein